ncbi:MAG: hypothetical protein M3082_09980 [Candidatus Dormibacteraeota bacterium]|nr:hypothetical protein [Candidatus Dormibacteraeota bacterium]
MPAPVAGLIYPDLGDLGEVLALAGDVNVVQDQAPKPVSLFAYDSGRRLDRHLAHEHRRQRLKQALRY